MKGNIYFKTQISEEEYLHHTLFYSSHLSSKLSLMLFYADFIFFNLPQFQMKTGHQSYVEVSVSTLFT